MGESTADNRYVSVLIILQHIYLNVKVFLRQREREREREVGEMIWRERECRYKVMVGKGAILKASKMKFL